MIYLSKSKYCGLWQCPKIAWLKKYKPEELELDLICTPKVRHFRRCISSTVLLSFLYFPLVGRFLYKQFVPSLHHQCQAQ